MPLHQKIKHLTTNNQENHIKMPPHKSNSTQQPKINKARPIVAISQNFQEPNPQ
jgi:hypothetical protein